MRSSTLRRSFTVALVAVMAAGALTPALAHHKPGHDRPKPKPKPKPKTPVEVVKEHPRCTGNPDDVQVLDLMVDNTLTWGLYAFPPQPPKGIVVFAHGYGHTAHSWRQHLARVARENGVVTVAMNYRGQIDYPGSPHPTSRGWQVAEGAADSIAAAQLLERACPGAKTIVMYGVSMGGNTAGLAVASQAKRRNGGPLFDYLVDVEGAMNVTETYFEARALARTGNEYATNAVEDIEREMGGTFEQKSDVYLERTVVNRVDDIAASGIKGVVVVHGVADGLVGYNQSPEFVTLLRSQGIPVDFFTAVTRGERSESGTTLDGYVGKYIPGYASPFAGHASETSTTHIVGAAGFERLKALFKGVKPACRYGVLDGTVGYSAHSPLYTEATC